jgi:hypothetical protein
MPSPPHRARHTEPATPRPRCSAASPRWCSACSFRGRRTRPAALLDEPGLIHDQHPARAEPLDRVGPELVAHGVGVPVRGAQQPLHPVRRHLAGGLGQCPAVFAFQLAQQAAQVGQHPGSRPGAGERTGDPPVRLLQAHCSALQRGHRAIAAHRHTLLPAPPAFGSNTQVPLQHLMARRCPTARRSPPRSSRSPRRPGNSAQVSDHLHEVRLH